MKNDNPPRAGFAGQGDLRDLAAKINQALTRYSDKDWNYSRISLCLRDLRGLASEYALWVELVSTDSKEGQNDIKTYSAEIAWGERHSNELGILELISLRLNKALTECTSDNEWDNRRPFIRLASKEQLMDQGITEALWYDVKEVGGEEFDNR